jgi:hypothetical protein
MGFIGAGLNVEANSLMAHLRKFAAYGGEGIEASQRSSRIAASATSRSGIIPAHTDSA